MVLFRFVFSLSYKAIPVQKKQRILILLQYLLENIVNLVTYILGCRSYTLNLILASLYQLCSKQQILHIEY